MVMENYHGQSILQEINKYFNFVLIPVEILFISVFLRYHRRLLKDKSLIILLNINVLSLLALSLPLIKYKHYNLYCQINRIISYLIRSVEAILVTSLLLKSYVNLYYPSYSIKKRTLVYFLYILYTFLAVCSIIELARGCKPCPSNHLSLVFYIFASVSFIILALIHDGSYLYEKGASDFFSTKELDFLLINTYLVCALPLMVNVILYSIFNSQDYLHPYHDVALILYGFKPIYLFLVLYNFNSDFNLCFKKLFCSCTKKNDENGRVVFNNSITIINVYSSSKI